MWANLGGCAFVQHLGREKTQKMNNSTNSVTYFGSWKSQQIPFVPEDPISQEEAEKRKSYYIGYYNNARQLERFEKYLDGKLNWQDEYVYWDNGKLKTRIMVKANGSRIIQHFDRSGSIIQ